MANNQNIPVIAGNAVARPAGVQPHNCPGRIIPDFNIPNLRPLAHASQQQHNAIVQANSLATSFGQKRWFGQTADDNAASVYAQPQTAVAQHHQADAFWQAAHDIYWEWRQLCTSQNIYNGPFPA